MTLLLLHTLGLDFIVAYVVHFSYITLDGIHFPFLSIWNGSFTSTRDCLQCLRFCVWDVYPKLFVEILILNDKNLSFSIIYVMRSNESCSAWMHVVDIFYKESKVTYMQQQFYCERAHCHRWAWRSRSFGDIDRLISQVWWAWIERGERKWVSNTVWW